jgi:hypothetical protein
VRRSLRAGKAKPHEEGDVGRSKGGIVGRRGAIHHERREQRVRDNEDDAHLQILLN